METAASFEARNAPSSYPTATRHRPTRPVRASIPPDMTSPADDTASPDHKIRELTEELSQARGELSQAKSELVEARQQQAATAEILRAISNTPSDLQGIFQEIATTAARLCDAYDAGVLQCTGDHLKLVAHHGLIPVGGPLPLTRGLVMGRAVLDRTILQVTNAQAETEEYPEGSEKARRDGARTILAVPLICAGEAIGAIFVRRTEVRPFTDRQIELMKTFADQAVIAARRIPAPCPMTKRTPQISQTCASQVGPSPCTSKRKPNIDAMTMAPSASADDIVCQAHCMSAPGGVRDQKVKLAQSFQEVSK